jgi:uncharacterized protein YcbX
MQPLIVSELNVYPVKSLGGFSVDTAEVFSKGLANDRRWMLVDENNRFLTQREVHKLSLLNTSIDSFTGQVRIHAGDESLLLPQVVTGETLFTSVWTDRVEVVALDAVFGEWFSKQIGIACKLVAFPEENPRPVDPDFAINSTDQTSLSDGYPIMIIGQSTLDDLNTRLEEPVPMNRFRPNIVFTGGLPHEEDKWKRFSIGGVAMAGVKPCARCVVTTIDQQTGVAGIEPLATLSNYRKVGNKVLFGQNVIPLANGIIKVGDEIALQ